MSLDALATKLRMCLCCHCPCLVSGAPESAPGGTTVGAHNTIVTARAGKDLVSCLVSGLLTIGPRFGGAIDDAARYFQLAVTQAGAPSQLIPNWLASS